jgi:hypothetical protein
VGERRPSIVSIRKKNLTILGQVTQRGQFPDHKPLPRNLQCALLNVRKVREAQP